MFQFILNFYNYSQLIYSVHHYIQFYNERKEHNIIYLDTIIQKIKKCGSVAIKFTQWIITRIENLYEQKSIKKNLLKFNRLLEDCPVHSINYTK